MKNLQAKLLVLSGLLSWALPLGAHHSLSATYQRDTRLQLEGRLVQFVFRNPHSFIHIVVPDDQGGSQRWAVEWTGTAALARRGMDAATLQPGDILQLTVNPSRSPGEYRALMSALLRPADGLSWGTQPGEIVD